MLPINGKWKLVIFTTLVAVNGAAAALFRVHPAWTWAGTLATAAGGLELYFTVPGLPRSVTKAAA